MSSLCSLCSLGPLGSLDYLPPEILEKILEYVAENFESLLACLRTSHSFQDVLREVRVPRGRVLRFSFLRAYSDIQCVRGPLLLETLDDLDYLETAAESLEGDLKVWLPRSRRVYDDQRGKASAPGFVKMVGETMWTMGVDALGALELLMAAFLRIVRERVSKHPRRTVAIHMSEFLRIRWRAGRCDLHVPISLSSFSRASLVSEALATFLQSVPITHLSCLLVSLKHSGRQRTLTSETRNLVFASPVTQTLTSFTIFDTYKDPITSYLVGSRASQDQSLHTCLPNLHTLKVSAIESHGQRVSHRSLNLSSILCFFTQDPVFASQITSIEGSGYMFPVFESSLNHGTSILLRCFPKIRTWNLLFCANERSSSPPVPFTVSSSQELHDTLTSVLHEEHRQRKPSENLSDLQLQHWALNLQHEYRHRSSDLESLWTFWITYHERYDLRLWYQR